MQRKPFSSPFVFFLPKNCAYCGQGSLGLGTLTGSKCVGDGNFIAACDDPVCGELAKRDARAYMHKSGKVLRKDMMDSPIWEVLGITVNALFGRNDEETPENIMVLRSNGERQPGWKIQNVRGGPWDISKSSSGQWRIPAIGPDETLKGASIDDLKASLGNEHWSTLDDFERRLNTIYAEEAAAYDAAVAAAHAQVGGGGGCVHSIHPFVQYLDF